MQKLTKKAKRGFTLIELMIVVAIIGILAAIAIPKFAELIRKSNEGATKGNLGAIRSALSIYYGDMEGYYPLNADTLTIGGKYLTTIPLAKAPNYHADGQAVVFLTVSANPTDVGSWYYNDEATNANVGNTLVNCTHTDTKGTVWTGY